MDVFKALGLSEGEERVYAALIELRSATTGPLYRRAGVSQSKVYEILSRLAKKGLAASIVKQGMTYWHPANPAIYLERVSEELETLRVRKMVLEKKLPSLLKSEVQPQEEARVLVGFNGFRTALYSLLEALKGGHELVVFGSPKPIPEPFYSFLKAYNLERVKWGVPARFIYGSALRSFATRLYDLPKTKLRFMRGLTPSTIAIGPDRVIMMTWGKEGKCFVLTGREIAGNYRRFFESIWAMAEE